MTTTTLVYDPADPATIRSPFDTYRRLREEAPLYHLGGRVWVLSRFADVFAAARDTETFSSAQGLSYEGGDIESLGLLPTIVMMDPPEHTAYRRLVSRGFTPRRVAGLEPAVRAFVVERIGAMHDVIRDQGTADFIAELAGPLPSFVVAHYLGVPQADRGRFDGWTNAIVSANADGDVIGGAQQAVGELYEYFTHLAERRRHEPGDDIISQLVHASLEDEPVRIEAVLGYAFVMVAGGNDTTTGMLGGSAELLTQRRDQRQVLLDRPELIPDAVEELLRLTSPVQGLSRTTTREVERYGQTIPAGSKVHLLYASANRDHREFGPTAEELDVQRRIDRIMTFTSGPHHCLGAAAARLQSRVALEELLVRLPDFEVDWDAGEYAPGAFVRRFTSLPITASV
ncbi:cytochrome P450 [Rhabdothermincola sediminis]|uniref:cytochrome P450 n=1 Tax=Rhabdothermincola sediminis TaxID=2751370 RepID=UPI001AA083DD|nr:cytochrome P450 [Rhabdothermincola sediminis]